MKRSASIRGSWRRMLVPVVLCLCLGLAYGARSGRLQFETLRVALISAAVRDSEPGAVRRARPAFFAFNKLRFEGYLPRWSRRSLVFSADGRFSMSGTVYDGACGIGYTCIVEEGTFEVIDDRIWLTTRAQGFEGSGPSEIPEIVCPSELSPVVSPKVAILMLKDGPALVATDDDSDQWRLDGSGSGV